MHVFVAHYFKISYYKFGYSATALYMTVQVTSAHLYHCFGTTVDKGRDSDVQVLRLNILSSATAKQYTKCFLVLSKRNNFK